MPLSIHPGDYVRLQHWPQCYPVTKVASGKVWLADDKGGQWSYGDKLKWQKEFDDERDERIERQRRLLD